MRLASRIERCRARMKKQELPALLVTHIENVRYLTGFTGSAGACIMTPDSGVFLTDGRYGIQASNQVKELEVRVDSGGKSEMLFAAIDEVKAPLGYEAEHVSAAQLGKWEAKTKARWVRTSNIVEDLRRVKDAEEIALTRKAVKVVDETFNYIRGYLKVGLTERQVAIEIDFQMRRLGAEKEGFDTIAASGPNSALPHARPSDRPLAAGDLLTLDFGALCEGYNSDLTRTVVMGRPEARQQEIYQTVLDAQLKSLAAIRAGIKGKDVDQVARDAIAAAGFGDQFPHSLGHSLGRSVHDGPALAKTVERELEAGMIITVEPGIYVEGIGGVRIEDDVLVTVEGCEILTKSPTELLCIA